MLLDDLRDIRRVYGRRMTRPLSTSQQVVFDVALDRLQIPQDLLKRGNLGVADIFGKDFPGFWFEIGFGNGDHLKNEALAHPDTAFFGAEPFINGMANFLKSIHGQDERNIRVYMDDAMTVIDALADQVLDGIFILNPDPWPKKRHWKRRIVQTEHVEKFVRVLKPGGKLIMTTDIGDLAEWMASHAAAHSSLQEISKDRQISPPGWIPTKYEQKGAAKGRTQTYLVFERII
jgi:tRNA (guanine-N7-)-methyltransferase